MKTSSVICDWCQMNLSTTGNSIDYRLALINESIPSRGGYVTEAMIYPPLKQNAHFCGVQCLKNWLGNSMKAKEPK